MKGNKEVIDLLNEVLGGELVAISQYFMHAKMCANWGYTKIAGMIRSESIEEMKHAEALTERILFLEGLPNLQNLGKLHIGQTVPEQLKSDLALEYKAVKLLNDGIHMCRERHDSGSEELLIQILVNEEKHIDWIETQLNLIDKLGEAKYLAEQI